MSLLVVEDELKLAQYLHKGLSENGHVVDLAHDSIEGRRLATGGEYDLVLLDLMLPGIDGFGVLAAMRAAARRTPVLVWTARETLASNLEDMPRPSAMVNDLLFLSHADRGAVARRGEPVSLAALAQQAVEFHEAPLDESRLVLRVDEPLFKRAVSNLLGNAIRFAERGSIVVLRIAPELPDRVQVVVHNQGRAIEREQLPRLFDRFFRGGESRVCPEQPAPRAGVGHRGGHRPHARRANAGRKRPRHPARGLHAGDALSRSFG